MNITRDDMLAMNNKQVAEVFQNGHAIDESYVEGKQYRGIDLSLPGWMNKILWKTFEKTFYLDPDTGVLRGWNIRLEQTGWNNPAIPKIKNGTPFTFGHYELRSTEGETFPKNWQGAQYLNYADAGNTYFDLARFTASPVVAINREKSDLLLGWEVFKIGFKKIAIADYWLLVEDGPIEYIAERPVE